MVSLLEIPTAPPQLETRRRNETAWIRVLPVVAIEFILIHSHRAGNRSMGLRLHPQLNV